MRWCLIVLAMLCTHELDSQQCNAVQIRINMRGMGAVRLGNLAMGRDESSEDSTDLAAVKTDPDLEALMEKADRYRQDQNYRVASRLWQAVLQRSGDSMFSDDGQTYYSLVNRVENVLSTLPPEGLKTYRITADAEAAELFNRSRAGESQVGDPQALSLIVRKYFISSLGDDAAWELGSIYLDRFDFTGARRLFEKIVAVHPDPSVPMDQVYVKLALCCSWLGDTESATEMLRRSREAIAVEGAAGDVAALPKNYEAVQRSLGQLTLDANQSEVLSRWSMRLGNSGRNGVMPSLPTSTMKSEKLVARWQYWFEPKHSKADRKDHVGNVRLVADGSDASIERTVNSTETKLIERWREQPWRPVGELLMDEERLFFRSIADVVAFDRDAIERQIASKGNADRDGAIAWRSLWRNSYEIDETTRMTEAIRRSWGGYGGRRNKKQENPFPTLQAEVQMFGDPIGMAMSMHDDLVYAIEGPRFDDRNRNSPARMGVQWNTTIRRSRTNFLTAYDRRTGAVAWSLPRLSEDLVLSAKEKVEANRVESKSANERVGSADGSPDAAAFMSTASITPAGMGDSEPFISSGGFMAPPIGYGDLILVPVTMGGAISVYALDPADQGRTVWKAFLCDEPESGSNPWSMVEMSIEGSDLLVSCGTGIVFTLDPASGMVRFAQRYQREGKPDPFVRGRGASANRKLFDGWSSDIVLPWGRQMICFSSDRQRIESYDRAGGKLVWECDMNPVGFKVDYLIGIYNDVLYAGGEETIIAYGLKSDGKLLWGTDQMFDGKVARGRAMLTPDGLYVPVENFIRHYSLDGDRGKGELVDAVEVDLGTDAPVGNLLSDGRRIWVHGGNRLYALGPEPSR